VLPPGDCSSILPPRLLLGNRRSLVPLHLLSDVSQRPQITDVEDGQILRNLIAEDLGDCPTTRQKPGYLLFQVLFFGALYPPLIRP